jgi:5-formyltetrahydrofolate cyclo-ligase
MSENDNSPILKFFEFSCEEKLIEKKFKIKEPDPENSLEISLPDIVITPLLAFDKKLNRIGYGKGCYDSTFEFLELTLNKEIVKIAFAYDEQFYGNLNGGEEILLPIEEHDKKVNCVITPSKVYI